MLLSHRMFLEDAPYLGVCRLHSVPDAFVPGIAPERLKFENVVMV